MWQPGLFQFRLRSTTQTKAFESKIHFLDVGQGAAALVEITADTRLLIDGGPDKSILDDLYKLMPFDDKKLNRSFYLTLKMIITWDWYIL